MTQPYQLYDYYASGNGWKVAQMLHHLDLPFVYHEVDILKAETRTPSFLKMNPNGKIPVLVTPTGEVLTESNAILIYLARDTPYLPTAPLSHYAVMSRLFWEQYSHEPFIATSRFWRRHPQPEQFAARLEERRPGCLAALRQMEDVLTHHSFFVDDTYTIADIALYAYTHTADESGFALEDYPAIGAWLARVQAQPGHLPAERKTLGRA